jgi:type IV secretion system protein TrbE
MVRGDFTVVHTYRFLDREGAKKLVMKAEQHYRSQVKGPITQIIEKITGEESDRIDTGQLVLAEDAQAALVEITAEGVNFGYHCMSLQVLGEDMADLLHTRKAIAAILSNGGYGVVNEVIHQVGAFMATIPGAADASVRATLVSTRNLADMAIVRSIHPGPAVNKYLTEQRRAPSRSLCLFPTPSGVPELLNLHVGDVGHFMVVGPNGAGKTSLINLLISMFQRYAPCRVIVLDKDKSCYLTVKALGGSYVSLTDAGGNTSRMNPLRWIDNPARWGDIARWIMGAMEAFGGEPINARQAQAINNAIAMSASAGADGARRLGAFMTVLQGMDADFAARLAPWVQSDNGSSANYGRIFDNEDDAFAEQLQAGSSGIVGIDVGGLLKDERLAPSVLEYLFMSIDDLVDGRTPTLIYLEEAWYLLANPRFRAGYEDWIKTMRKRMGAVGLSTQSVEDIRRSGISSTLNDNIKTRIFLPNSQALASLDVYTQLLGLTPEHVQLIRSLTPKRHYMLWQDGRCRVLDASMPPNVLALTRSDALARDAFNRHLDQGGDDYVARYIKEITNA